LFIAVVLAAIAAGAFVYSLKPAPTPVPPPKPRSKVRFTPYGPESTEGPPASGAIPLRPRKPPT